VIVTLVAADAFLAGCCSRSRRCRRLKEQPARR